jgi:phosphomannomutase
MGILGAVLAKRTNSLIAAMDYRKNNKMLLKAFAEGYGKEIVFLGAIPTPALAYNSKLFGMMLTASHNPSEYAGAKFFKRQTYISGKEMDEIKNEFGKFEGNFEGKQKSAKKNKVEKSGITAKPAIDLNTDGSINLVNNYLMTIPEIKGGIFDLCGGAVCAFKELFPKRIFDEPDPEYSKHSAEPKDDTLGKLKEMTLKEKMVGFAFDGDGDRLQVCDKGKLIEGDVTAAFITENYMKRHDRIVLSIDCRQEVFDSIRDYGAIPVTSKVGDANVVQKGLEEEAIFSAERSGHFIFFNHAPNSDGIYTAAALSKTKMGEFSDFAKRFKNVTLKEELFIEADFGKLKERIEEEEPEELITIDGIKAKFDDYTLLIRKSTTEPKIRINSEGENKEMARTGMELAKALLKKSRTK